MSNATTPTIAVLGAGHVGPAIARLALDAGHSVAIATSGDPGHLALVTQFLIPGAAPLWAGDAIARADIVVLAMPLNRFLRMDPNALSEKLVIDAMNYWAPTDGRLPPPFDDESIGTSEVVAVRLQDATVVKTLNHVGYHELETYARPSGSVDRRALGVAGNDLDAVATVSAFVDRIGYDALPVGPLSGGRVLQPGGPVFGAVLRREDFERAVHDHSGQQKAFGLAEQYYGRSA
ncbi:MAG TPA: NAD(P)-binding domain-containing protein [Jiangellaceae bacterium]|nr:NAD(P)-binding domain-containing protein [Jiangellaceae bacterium]